MNRWDQVAGALIATLLCTGVFVGFAVLFFWLGGFWRIPGWIAVVFASVTALKGLMHVLRVGTMEYH